MQQFRAFENSEDYQAKAFYLGGAKIAKLAWQSCIELFCLTKTFN